MASGTILMDHAAMTWKPLSCQTSTSTLERHHLHADGMQLMRSAVCVQVMEVGQVFWSCM
jgi:hypothetical protein